MTDVIRRHDIVERSRLPAMLRMDCRGSEEIREEITAVVQAGGGCGFTVS